MSTWNRESDRFLVLMEDVTLRHARFLDVTHVVTVDAAAGILSTLARLHAPYWGSRSLDTEFGFLEVPNKGDNYDNFLTLGPGLLNAELETDLKARLAASSTDRQLPL